MISEMTQAKANDRRASKDSATSKVDGSTIEDEQKIRFSAIKVADEDDRRCCKENRGPKQNY